MTLIGVIITVAVLVGVAVLILLFERKRARQIERDLRGMAEDRHTEGRQGPDAPR